MTIIVLQNLYFISTVQPFIVISIAITTIAFPARLSAYLRSPEVDLTATDRLIDTNSDQIAQNDLDFDYVFDIESGVADLKYETAK